MKKRKAPILLILGAALILLSVTWVVVLQIRANMGAKESRGIVAKMEQLLPERSAGIPGMYPNPNMPVLEIDGADYAAMLEIPSLNVALPVADAWSSNQLSHTPARFCGSVYNNSLVIGGGDETHQFAFCDWIDLGTVITVTDMTGVQFTYTVTGVERSETAQSQWLANGESDLTLFCRDTYTMDYIAVRCAFAYGP